MKIEVKKFGDILISRPTGREAGMIMKAYLKPAPTEPVELDSDTYGKERVICLPSDNASVAESIKILRNE